MQDYRDVNGRYDAIVSVEMIEAVGDRWWPTYFKTLDERLAVGGRIGLQAILMPHDRLMATQGSWTWIHKYIFPGGVMPSEQVIDEVLRGPHLADAQRPVAPAPTPTPTPCNAGETGSTTTPNSSTAWASTARSAACGPSTWPTARPGSAPATSTSPS